MKTRVFRAWHLERGHYTPVVVPLTVTTACQSRKDRHPETSGTGLLRRDARTSPGPRGAALTPGVSATGLILRRKEQVQKPCRVDGILSTETSAHGASIRGPLGGLPALS